MESQRRPNRSASSVGRINAIAVQRIGDRPLKPAPRRQCSITALISTSIWPVVRDPQCHPGASGFVLQRIEIRPLPSNSVLVAYAIPSLFFVIFAGVMNTRLMQSSLLAGNEYATIASPICAPKV